MIIVAFSTRTSKILPRILCRRMRHVALISPNGGVGGGLVLYQFVRPGHIVPIPIKSRDLTVLSRHGWRFVYLAGADMRPAYGLTCVGYAKRAAKIRAPWIFTPDALYKYLTD